MPKIIVELGVPASGKSTCAKNRIAKDGNFVRVNRDDIRSMGFGMNKWTPQREKWTVATELAAIQAAIQNGFTPIVDSTNLTEKRIKSLKDLAKTGSFFEGKQITVEFCDHRDVPLSVCIERDSHREGSARVGRVIIEKLAAQGKLLKTDKKVVLCDIDGTIADLTERKKWLELPCEECSGQGGQCKNCKGTGKVADWTEFFRNVSEDKPILSTINMLIDYCQKGYEIWLVSGRPVFAMKGEETLRVGDMTLDWLGSHGVPFDHIFMRDGGDTRPDTMAKRDILNYQILKNITKEQIVTVIDDRPCVIRMWREEGLNVIDVGDGVEF